MSPEPVKMNRAQRRANKGGKNMELKVAERLMLLNLLPKEGDIVTLRVIRDAQQAIGLTEEELEALEIHSPEQGICQNPDCKFRWDLPEGAKETGACPRCGSKDVAQGRDAGRLIWKGEADVPKEIPIGKKALQVIVDALKEASDNKALNLQQLALYEKFVPPVEDED